MILLKWGSLGLPKRVFLELRAEVCEAPYDPALEVPEHTTSAPNSIGKQVTKDQRRTKAQKVAWKIPWRGAWQAIVHGVAKSWTQLSD